MSTSHPGETLTLADDLIISRMGYGAMQLAGPGVFGPPEDPDEAIAVLREVVELGITHIDTSDYYGPYVVNELIKEALYPYPDDLRIVTKVGAVRGDDGSWMPDLSPEGLVDAVHSNIDHLDVEALDVVNLRLGGVETPTDDPLGEPFSVLAELQRQGLIRHLGVSNVTPAQLTEAQSIAPVVTVQNLYNVVNRQADELVDRCERENIGFTPFFPLGGFTPLQSEVLQRVAARVEATAQQVALAWLLQRSPAIAVIPGTSSVAHLHENVAAASIELPADAVEDLNSIGA
jgi:aryl-alcohol dehydrogenase-like predicted oxidoreductase